MMMMMMQIDNDRYDISTERSHSLTNNQNPPPLPPVLPPTGYSLLHQVEPTVVTLLCVVLCCVVLYGTEQPLALIPNSCWSHVCVASMSHIPNR